MSKAVLISIRPKWCELIAIGVKTIEVRKTRPKLETPFKCYIYCTKNKPTILCKPSQRFGNGLIIGEFMCDVIYEIKNVGYGFKVGKTEAETTKVAHASCLDFGDMHDYFGHKGGYGWHISSLKIYEKPKRLSEFMYEKHKNGMYIHTPVFCPPQNWCYVEEEIN